MFEKFYIKNRDKIADCSIQELRILAHGLGLDAPTTEDKQVLYDAVVNLMLGDIALKSEYDNVDCGFEGEDSHDYSANWFASQNVTIKLKPAITRLQFRSETSKTREKEINGTLYLEGGKYYLIQRGYFIEKEKIEFPEELVCMNGLMEGSYVQLFGEGENRRVVCEKSYENLSCHNSKKQDPDWEKKMLGSHISEYLGGSELFVGDKSVIRCNIADHEDFADELIKIIYETPGVAMSVIGSFKYKGREKFIDHMTDGYYINLEDEDTKLINTKLQLLLKRLTALDGNGTPEIVVIDDLTALEDYVIKQNNETELRLVQQLLSYIDTGMVDNTTILAIEQNKRDNSKIKELFKGYEFKDIDVTNKLDIFRGDTFTINRYLKINRNGEEF